VTIHTAEHMHEHTHTLAHTQSANIENINTTTWQ